jgi:hypothetical protein
MVRRTLTLILLTLLGTTAPSVACQEGGLNIQTQTGILSNLSGDSATSKLIQLTVPETGCDYEIKVNFIKVETSASAIDAYVDHANEQAQARGEASGSAKWNQLRERLKTVTSKADFEVYDSSGRLVGRASDLGATTFFRTVKFTAHDSQYTVKLLCASGAGMYHLTLEWD